MRPLEAALAPLCPVPCLCLGPQRRGVFSPAMASETVFAYFPDCTEPDKTAFCPVGCWEEISVDTDCVIRTQSSLRVGSPKRDRLLVSPRTPMQRQLWRTECSWGHLRSGYHWSHLENGEEEGLGLYPGELRCCSLVSSLLQPWGRVSFPSPSPP